jgi:RNA polymerase sigma-70 factor (ECF subfamily)
MFDSAIQTPFSEAPSSDQHVGALAAITCSREPESDAPVLPAPRRVGQISDAEFKALYDTHRRLVWRALNRFGVPESDVMDLTQKVFLIAYLKLPEFERRSQLSTWLWGICRRVAIAFRRSGAMRYEVVTDPLGLEASSQRHAEVSNELDTTRQVLLEHFLSKLSEPQRVVFTLFEVDGLRGTEIAAHLKISLGTVRSRLRYARELLRREVRRLRLVRARAAAAKRAYKATLPLHPSP